MIKFGWPSATNYNVSAVGVTSWYDSLLQIHQFFSPIFSGGRRCYSTRFGSWYQVIGYSISGFTGIFFGRILGSFLVCQFWVASDCDYLIFLCRNAVLLDAKYFCSWNAGFEWPGPKSPPCPQFKAPLEKKKKKKKPEKRVSDSSLFVFQSALIKSYSHQHYFHEIWRLETFIKICQHFLVVAKIGQK